MVAVNVDLVGLFISVCLLGIRYPHYVILAALVNFLGFCMGIFILPAGIESVIASGAFSAAAAPGLTFAEKAVLLISPFFANYAAGRISGRPDIGNILKFLSPFAALNNPFFVINLRFAAAFLLYNFSLLFF